MDKCNELVALAGMTVAEADEYFKRMGYDVEVVEETRPGKTTTRTQTVKDWYNADTGE